MADTIFHISAVIALMSIGLLMIRTVIGPTSADRAVALDAMTIITISLIVYIARLSERMIYLDVALVYALISFLSILALARYLEKGI
ncbi:MAG: monovalent cation/H+ antiporter complex subunit F [bacterium]